ncbi:MAG: 16S rRNA (guanine(966)-N(2))-methyltransferase RsmD [Deltaproteobacteria bacterium]|nr:16S rRNA (guanine(966)-N(2))-methyltransferase RsmD [Deltaproteobacteria bacterium]
MRVIGGKCKGRRLAAVKGASTRPTSDKVREAVFDILPREFPFRSVLDLFAGTGAMGIEALSRGAQDAAFVDMDAPAVQVIRKNLSACGLAGQGRVYRRDARSALRSFARKGERFDLIFIDPPYDSSLVEETLKDIDRAGLLSLGGVVVAETSKRTPVAAELSSIGLVDERRYGDTLVYFYEVKDGPR